VLAATLTKLPELSERRKLWGRREEGDGDSNGTIDTRPAMSDTRCREDRLRGRGEDGEREGLGRIDPAVVDGEEVRDSDEETIKDSMVGVADNVRAEKDVRVGGGIIIGDVLINE
jgi:hypothetical protein